MSAEHGSSPIERAAQTRVLVIGGGIAGLVAAMECAKIGMQVALLEASDLLGGTIRGAELDGVTVDVGTECFSTRGGAVGALVDELGLGADVAPATPGTPWVAGLPGGLVAPLPSGGMLGIPENPFGPEVLRILGWRGGWRAYVDRLRPVLTIGSERSLGRLVRTRMGALVRDRLVAPITLGAYGLSPDEIDVDLAVPGLNAGLTRTGSLAGGVAQLGVDASANEELSISGGMTKLVDALSARLVELGVDVQLDRTATAIARVATAEEERDAAWLVSTAADDAEGDEELEPLVADFVILATQEAAARALLAGRLSEGAAGQSWRVDVVSLLLDDASLDNAVASASTSRPAPHGPTVFMAPGHSESHATALVHESAKWPWLAARLNTDAPHRHLVRVSFGTAALAPATAGLDQASATALALVEASTMLGVPLGSDALVDSHLASFTQARPASAIGQREDAAAVRSALASERGLVVVGAWLSGSGLAQVIPDAQEQAELVRQAALWGAEPAL